MSSSPGRRALAAGALAVGALHAAPGLTSWDRPRRLLLPALAGQGRPGGVALTFDDGPDPLGTPAVLEQLAALGLPATFFMLGSQVRRHPDVARAVVEAGHGVAVHGDEHRAHVFRTPAALGRDLRRATRSITEVTGHRPRWFRPPYGVLSSGSLLAARSAGLQPLLWSTWGRDWEPTTPERVVRRLLRGLGDRGTLLLHDSDCTSTPRSWEATVAAIPLLHRALAERGLEVRRLEDHLAG